MGSFVSRGLINVGQSFKSWTTTPLKREAIMQTLPVMLAFFYFFLIVFTPLVLSLSGYSPRALGSLCGLFFMLIFIQTVWHYASFLERTVVDVLGENDVVAAIRNIAVMIYFIAPVLLLKLSSHFGGDGGAALAGILESSNTAAKESADSGANSVKTGASIATKIGGKLL